MAVPLDIIEELANTFPPLTEDEVDKLLGAISMILMAAKFGGPNAIDNMLKSGAFKDRYVDLLNPIVAIHLCLAAKRQFAREKAKTAVDDLMTATKT